MIHANLTDLLGIRPKWQSPIGKGCPPPPPQLERLSETESAMFSVRQLAPAVISAPDSGVPLSPQPATFIHNPRRRRDSRWLNLFEEDSNSQSYHKHDGGHRQAIQESETISYSPRAPAPLPAPEVFDFRHCDQAAARKETIISDSGTLYCESPRPFTERADTYGTYASDHRHYSTLGGILNEMERPNQHYNIPNGMPNTWVSASGTTPTDDQSFYDQQVDMSDAQDGYPYSH